MNDAKRFRRFKDATRLSHEQLAEIFGVEHETVVRWYCGTNNMASDCKATLARLENEHSPAICPNIRLATAQAFYAGKKLLEVTSE